MAKKAEERIIELVSGTPTCWETVTGKDVDPQGVGILTVIPGPSTLADVDDWLNDLADLRAGRARIHYTFPDGEEWDVPRDEYSMSSNPLVGKPLVESSLISLAARQWGIAVNSYLLPRYKKTLGLLPQKTGSGRGRKLTSAAKR